MPSVSKPQQKLMSAVAHGWEMPGGKGPSKKVATEFHKADLTKSDHLKKLYAGGSFKDRKKNFDDGGSYLDYITPTAPYMSGDNSGAPSASDISALTAGSTYTSPDSTVDPGAAPTLDSGASGSSGTSALSSMLKALGISNGAGTGAITALAGLLGAAGKYKQNAQYMPQNSPPPLFGGAAGSAPGAGSNGSSGGYGPPGGYNFRNYQGVGASSPGLGYAPRTAVTPNIPNYYTYGQGPAQPFYTGTSAQVPGAKRGGKVKIKMAGGGAIDDVLAKMFSKYAAAADVPGKRVYKGSAVFGAPQSEIDAALQAIRDKGGFQMTRGSGDIPAARGNQGMSPGNWADRMDTNYQDMIDALNEHGQVKPGDNNLNTLSNPFPGGLNALSPGSYARGGSTTPQRYDAGGMIQPPMSGMGGMPPDPISSPMMRPPQMPQAPGPLNAAPGMQRPQIMPPRGPQQRPMAPPMGAPPMAQTQPMRPPQAGRFPMMMRAEGGPSAPTDGALSSVARHVKGPGDGTSDSIPARLANGEYVMDAQTVSMLGNGDNGAGAKQLDTFRENVRKHKGESLAKGKMAPDAHPNLMRYLGGKV
jgi:hypothetical protein